MSNIRFSRVTDRVEKVAIIATGQSLKGKKLELCPGTKVICVNAAIRRFHHIADFWFTLDPSPDNIRIMRKPYDGVTYYAAVPEEFNQAFPQVRFLKRITGDGHGRYRTRANLCPDKRGIHTGNSAWGALQLAVHMGATNIALFGIDGDGSYYYGGQPRNLSMMPDLFNSAVEELNSLGVSVVNGSPQSVVDAFPRMTVEDAVRWLEAR